MTRTVAFAGFNLESVTAVTRVCNHADFERVATRGETLLERFRGTNTVPGGCIDILERHGMRMLPVVHTLLGALGPASDEAVERYAQEIVESLRRHAGTLDGVILFLHGACWAAGFRDVEKYVIDRVAAVLPDVPLIGAFDYHGNLDAATIENLDAAFAYRQSPHIDMGETGRRAAACMVAMLEDGLRPHLAISRPGLVLPSILTATGLSPLREIIAEARRMEAESPDYLDISIMAGFAYADSHNTGASVLCVHGGGDEQARAIADHFAARLYENRHALNAAIAISGVDEAVARAKAQPKGGRAPLVLLEHADRMNDSTHILAALLENGIEGVAVPFFLDPAAAAVAAAAGEGATVRLALGGHSSAAAGPTLDVEAKVLWAGEKSFAVSGRYQQGSRVDLGLTALIEVRGIRISVVSHFAFAVDGDPFYIFGEDPRDYDIILLRSKTHFRDFYEPLAGAIVVVDTPDLGPADLTKIPYRELDTSTVFPFVDA